MKLGNFVLEKWTWLELFFLMLGVFSTADL